MKAVNELQHKAKYEYPYMAIGYTFDDPVLHFHPETEVLYVYEGSILATIDSENYILTEGDICIILPSQIHNLIQLGHIKIRVMKLYPIINLINVQLEKNIYKKSDIHYDFLLEHITKMVDEDTEKKKGYELAVTLSAGSIMLYIRRNLPQTKRLDVSPKKLAQRTSFMVEINAYLEENYQNDFSLEEIATVFHYTKSHFSRLFHEITGTTFIDYFTFFRLRKSIQLLKNSRMSIDTVASLSGFNSARSYSRAFNKHYDQSPGSYRKQFFLKD